ncbi:MAG: aminodeoxychorismate lyase [Gammaproteobacteria bacterium]|nr:MAG: aminodeoxychorismate lyase [Gammaproteobacteria bacterium]
MSRSWIDGSPGDCVPVDDRGLSYADGLFETLRVDDGTPCLWARHKARLRHGCRVLGIPMPEEGVLDEEAREYARRLGSGVLRLMLTRGSGGRGYSPPESVRPRRIWSIHPLPQWPASWLQRGVEVGLCRTRLSAQPLLAGLKHMARLEQVMARQELGTGLAEGLMMDGQGRVIEGTMSNLFVHFDGRWWTPRIDHSGVAGVVRSLLLETGMPDGSPVAELETLRIDTLFAAEAMLLTNSVIGAWAVRRLAGVEFDPPLELARMIRERTCLTCRSD